MNYFYIYIVRICFSCCDRKARVASAQSFALWQQAKTEFMRRNHSRITCSRHGYILLFFAHIPFVVNNTFNATPPERVQQLPLLFTTNRTDRTFFLWRLLPGTTFASWLQHHFVAIGKARTACAQSFALWQQATIKFMCRNHSIIACSRHVYTLLFLAHIPFVVNHTFNATPPERLQHSH